MAGKNMNQIYPYTNLKELFAFKNDQNFMHPFSKLLKI